jgi:N-hydroxyarylamine O-acetyltransferase
MIATSTLDAYLQRLQLPADRIVGEGPSVAGLHEVHRAQVERIPYETTWLHMGEPWGIDPLASVQRIARSGRGGYCFHVNGALSEVLRGLGYRVTRHVAGVHDAEGPSAERMRNHLVLIVHDLPTDANPAGRWIADAGLGDGLHDPLPLVAGEYRQGLFMFQLEQVRDGVGDWHLTHDPRGSLVGVSIDSTPVGMAEFADRHRFLTTSPDSGFARTPTVQRRRGDRVDMLRGLVLTTLRDDDTAATVIEDRADWFELLAELGLRLDISESAGDRLWAKVSAAHTLWADAADAAA